MSVQARSLTALWMGIMCEIDERRAAGSEAVFLESTAV